MHAPYFDALISLTPTITSAAMLSSVPNSMRMKTPAQPLREGGAGVSGRTNPYAHSHGSAVSVYESGESAI
jgi:hypothetical protein